MPPELPEAENFGPEAFAEAAHVSRETLERFRIYVKMLEEWNGKNNLVSEKTLPVVWHRHVWDSAQLFPLIPENVHSVVDLGSGAGFPALVLSILLGTRAKVTMYEATGKKCAFLNAVVKELGLKAEVRKARIESAAPEKMQLITARAFTNLPQLLDYARPFTGKSTLCLFPKGQSWETEVREAQKNWKFTLVTHPSQTHSEARILQITHLKPLYSSRDS